MGLPPPKGGPRALHERAQLTTLSQLFLTSHVGEGALQAGPPDPLPPPLLKGHFLRRRVVVGMAPGPREGLATTQGDRWG